MNRDTDYQSDADALYCNYFLIATLMAAGVDVLFEQNGSRITDYSAQLH